MRPFALPPTQRSVPLNLVFDAGVFVYFAPFHTKVWRLVLFLAYYRGEKQTWIVMAWAGRVYFCSWRILGGHGMALLLCKDGLWIGYHG